MITFLNFVLNCVIVLVSYFHLFISFKCSFECELDNVPLKEQFKVVCFLNFIFVL